MKNPVNKEIKEKLNKAFRKLRSEYHFLARQNFLCCQGCAWAEAAHIIEKSPDKYKGIVFYHQQDTDGLRGDNPGCFIAFGETGQGVSLSEENVGKVVHAVMLCAGLKVEWNGNIGTRIKVTL